VLVDLRREPDAALHREPVVAVLRASARDHFVSAARAHRELERVDAVARLDLVEQASRVFGEGGRTLEVEIDRLEEAVLPDGGRHGTVVQYDCRIAVRAALSSSTVTPGFWQTAIILRSRTSIRAAASGIFAAISGGTTTTPCWSAWRRSPGRIHRLPTLTGAPKSTMWT